MKNQLKWAQAYLEWYEELVKQNTSAGNIVVSFTDLQLVNLAKAIVADGEKSR